MNRVLLARAAAAALAAGFVGLSASAATAASCVGACGALGPNGDITAPPTAATYGWVSTWRGVDGAGQLPGVGGTDGSVFTTTAFAANEGDVLKYDFNYVSSDGQAQPDQFIYEDYAWVQLVNLADSSTVMLFNARSEPTGLEAPGAGLPPIDPGVVLNPASSTVTLGGGLQGNMAGGPLWAPLGDFSGWCWGPGCGYTGWITSSYTVRNAGLYQLQFGVTNWGDTVYDSGLAYAGINIGGRDIEDDVPEPAAWALMLLGFAGAGAVLRRRRALINTATI